MPRKRAARAATHKVTQPGGTEGDSLTAEEKQRKLQVLLKDFDMEVCRRISNMRSEIKTACDDLRNAYMWEIMKYPKDFLDSKYCEVAESNLELEGSLKTIKSYGPNKLAALPSVATVTEEDEVECTPGFVVPKTVKATQKKAKQGKKRAPPLTTPAQNTKNSYWSATPLVTPKFDPRLPLHSADLRTAKPNERIMSMAGSPLAIPEASASAVKEKENQVVVPIARGRTMVLDLNSQQPHVDLTGLSRVEKRQAMKKVQQVTQQLQLMQHKMAAQM